MRRVTFEKSGMAYLLASIGLLAGCSSSSEEAPPPATPVRVAEAVEGPAAPAIRTSGLLANEDEFRLSFKVGGVIKSISVNEGDRVRRGQKLAEIEQTEIDAQVEQARQAHAKAQRDFQRGERLYADQVISLEQLQDLKTQTAVTEAALQAAQFNWSYAAIVAPHDGTVLRRMAEERELVAAGAPILVLGTEQGFVVRAGLADREIVQVKTGDRADVRLDALPSAKLQGTVTEVASAADAASGLFTVEVAIEDTDLPLRSGLVAKLTIEPSAAKNGSRVYLPIAAIVEGQGNRASVFVLEEDRARRREVNVAFIEEDRVALLDGIRVGEQVITDGALYLEDGEAVGVQREADSG
jgi:RND family efflux transporter MFP subunit